MQYIKNSASHSATSGSISGSYGKEVDYHVDNETGEKVSETYAKNNPNSTTKIVPKAGPKFNPALPMHEQGEDSTTTKATFDIEGKHILIEAGKDVFKSSEKHEFKQSGLTLAVSSPAIDMAMKAQESLKHPDSARVHTGALGFSYE